MISKNKPKRGRPKAFPDSEVQKASEAVRGRTRRQHLNTIYSLKALQELMKESKDGRMQIRPKYRWLYDESRREKTSRYFKATILAELGRIKDSRAIRKLAEEICKSKPKTKDAVALIRRLRGKSATKGSVSQLTMEITATIAYYLRRYREITPQQVNEALKMSELPK